MTIGTPNSWEWTTDWSHIFLSGDTNSGKTCLANQIHDQSHRASIFLNPMKVDVCGYTCYTLAEIKGAIKQGYTTIDWRISADEDVAQEQAEALRLWLYNLSEATAQDFQVVVDECHQIARSGDRGNALVKLVKEGRNKGIKTVSLTQEPQLVSQSVLRQSKHHIWLGGYNAYAEDYLKNYNLPIDEIHNNDKHDALLMNEKMEPIGRFQTDPQYY